MPSPPPIDLEALSLDDLQRLVVELLVRVTALEEENRALRDELAQARKVPQRPKLAPGGMDKATEPDKRATVKAARQAQRSGRQAHAAGDRGADPHGGGAAGLAAQGLRALHRPGSHAHTAGDPLPP